MAFKTYRAPKKRINKQNLAKICNDWLLYDLLGGCYNPWTDFDSKDYCKFKSHVVLLNSI